jgi:hypothetical protein
VDSDREPGRQRICLHWAKFPSVADAVDGTRGLGGSTLQVPAPSLSAWHTFHRCHSRALQARYANKSSPRPGAHRGGQLHPSSGATRS